MNKPQELSMAEWAEIMKVSEVQESWGIEEGETPEQFADMAYGVKFQFSAGTMPGYVGDLYILTGDSFDEPMVFIRKNGVLSLAD